MKMEKSMQSPVAELFRGSPFAALVEYGKKVHQCVEMLRPLMAALMAEDYGAVGRLRLKMSRLEHDAELMNKEIRDFFSQRTFLPVDGTRYLNFLSGLEKTAHLAEEFSVILTLRETRIHAEIQDRFKEYLNQVFQVSGTFLIIVVEFNKLTERSRSSLDTRAVQEYIRELNSEKWKCDKMSRRLLQASYALEGKESVLNILFYEKMVTLLSNIADQSRSLGKVLYDIIEKR